MQNKLLKKIRAIVNKLGVDTVKNAALSLKKYAALYVKNAALSLKKYAALYPKMRGPAK